MVGGYSLDPQGDPPTAGTGLRVLDLDDGGPDAPRYRTVGHEPLVSPTWVVPHPTRPWLVGVSESAPSEVVCTGVEDDGALTVLGRCTTGGDFGCHLALTPDGRQVLVAHYGSGTVESFALDDAGRLAGPSGRFVSSAPLGPDPERQDGPHAHQVVLDPGRPGEVLVCDLGTDRVHRLRLHDDGRLTSAAPALVLPPGFGPRHLVVAGDTLVVVGELTCELWLARRDGDGWRPTQVVPASGRPQVAGAPRVAGTPQPAGTASSERAMPSGLRVTGDLVVVATRGTDTVSVFRLDGADATVTSVAEVSCGGVHPRDLVVADGSVWVADQGSDEVVVLSLAAAMSGRAEVVCRVPFPRPACVVLLDVGPAAGR